MADTKDNSLMLEYFVPIQSSAELNGDFIINGIAINETTTSNGHQFIGEELSKAANTMIGVPLLKDHDNSIDSIVGKVQGAHWDEGMRNIPFRAIVKDPKVKQLIKDGLLNTVSVGAHVNPADIEESEDGSIIPHNIFFKELSVVAVPADSGATFSMALNNAYRSHSTKMVENSTKDERRDNMTEEEKKTESEAPEAEETPVEAEVSEEEKALDEKIAALRIAAKKKQLAMLEADADEAKAEEAEAPEEKEEAKEEAKEESEDEAEEEEEDEVEEKGDYAFSEGYNFIGIQRKSYVYN